MINSDFEYFSLCTVLFVPIKIFLSPSIFIYFLNRSYWNVSQYIFPVSKKTQFKIEIIHTYIYTYNLYIICNFFSFMELCFAQRFNTCSVKDWISRVLLLLNSWWLQCFATVLYATKIRLLSFNCSMHNLKTKMLLGNIVLLIRNEKLCHI